MSARHVKTSHEFQRRTTDGDTRLSQWKQKAEAGSLSNRECSHESRVCLFSDLAWGTTATSAKRALVAKLRFDRRELCSYGLSLLRISQRLEPCFT